MNTWNYFSLLLILFPALASCELDVNTQPYQGTCQNGWVDGTSVGMGCLYFNHNETMHWMNYTEYCQLELDNARAVEIHSPKVQRYLMIYF